ncbi:Sfi1 spindle body protein-domain-containing protein [Peziza echinospora]|nr:Sfi1 spindle body protein-domain-containing protein [Peziza echinospora]
MLSQSSPDYDSATAPASRSYSKDDLQRIYEIICLATLIPSEYAFRCIWRAYETVLRFKDIDPAHDSKYFRVLINLGGGGSLQDKFSTFLRENGYDAATLSSLKPPSAALISLYTRTRYTDAKERRDRSASNTSGSNSLDEEDDFFTIDRNETDTFTNGSDVLQSKRRKYEEARRGQKRSQPDLAKGLPPPPPPRHHAAAQNQRASLFRRQLTPVREEQSRQAAAGNRGYPDDTASSDSADAGQVGALHLARKYFGRWHGLVAEQAAQRRWMEAQATAYDRRVLLREAFTEWLFLLKEKQTVHARNIYLLGQAFATWAHKTAAIINRSNEMRQRIMARKYFSAWRSLVLENEAKVRRFQLNSALFRWRTALYKRRQEDAFAGQVYEYTLARRVRRLWWYKACEAVAPSWHNNFLLREALATWKQQAAAVTHNEAVAARKHDMASMANALRLWLGRTDRVIDMEEDADDHHAWTVARKHLDIWRWQASCAPAVAQVRARSGRRLLTAAITTWRFRLRQSLAATALLRASTLKHAFRAWNLQLRHNVVVVQVEERIAVDILYAWVLQARYQAFVRRTRQWILARHALAGWRERTKRAIAARRKGEHTARSLVRHRLAAGALEHWHARVAHLQNLEARAARFRTAIAARHALAVWREAYQRKVARLDAWAYEARYFLLTTHHLKIWRAAKKTHHRQLLKSTFSSLWHARRRRMLTAVLTTWRNRTGHVMALDVSATAYDESRLLSTHMQTWQARLNNITALSHKLESYSHPVLVSAVLQRWLTYHDHLASLDRLANEYRSSRISLAAANAFRKWRMKGFVNVTRMNAAEMMWERTEKRHDQILLRMWLEKTQERVSARRFEEQLDGGGGGIGDDGLSDDGSGITVMNDRDGRNGGARSPSRSPSPIISFPPRTPMRRNFHTPHHNHHLQQATSSSLYGWPESDEGEHDEHISAVEEPLIDLTTPRPQHITITNGISARPQQTTPYPFRNMPSATPATATPILQTPSARAARARELMFRLTPARSIFPNNKLSASVLFPQPPPPPPPPPQQQQQKQQTQLPPPSQSPQKQRAPQSQAPPQPPPPGTASSATESNSNTTFASVTTGATTPLGSPVRASNPRLFAGRGGAGGSEVGGGDSGSVIGRSVGAFGLGQSAAARSVRFSNLFK